MNKPRAFIFAPNRADDPFKIENVAVGVLFVFPDGRGPDYLCKTIDDQAELSRIIDPINWQNPEVADYVRERLDRPTRCAFWEVEVKDGDTVETVFERMLQRRRA